MTDQPRLRHIRSTSQLIKQTTATFIANLHTFLFLSLLLFSFRSLVESGSHLLTSFIDGDASLKSLLSRLDFPDLHSSTRRLHLHHHHHPRPHHHRRRPFLHLTRVGTLDDDFFSGDDDFDRHVFNPLLRRPVNGTLVSFSDFDTSLGFSNEFVNSGIGIGILEMFRHGVTFKTSVSLEKSFDKEELSYDDDSEQEGTQNGQEMDRIVDFQMFIKGLELGRRDMTALFFLVSFLSAAYGWVILGFTAIYSWVLGIVFVTVVNDLVGRFSSLVGVVWDGSRLGIKRLSGFILMRWAVRDALTQLLGLWFFGEIQDQYSFFKLFVRLKLMPFSVISPWIRGFEKEISGFFITWSLADTFLAFIFAVDAWVAIVDSRRTGREIVKEGCYLLLTMMNQAIQIKCMEAILCGSFARWALDHVFGKSFAMILQSTVEVYFMVAWLIYYFAARSRNAHVEGRRFGRRELEGLVDGHR
ncbi:uncharacterized protein LOC123201858 [Mangifera indica]|uniref:uncharacterized protein LOC123201858 n=1 Tax=Mangifera indica TaxID=29780 RepID=UPI001CFB2B9B|nr:uncharacterized protein LOC123201858 [Mangifera indica]